MSTGSKYTLYLDESGTASDTDVVCVAGFLASDEQWERFAVNWSDTLADFGLPTFRSVDFAHSKKAFSKWSKHETDALLRSERQAFFRKLLGHVRLRVRRSFASSVFMDEYREIDGEYAFHEAIAPRTFCARACIVRCRAWARKYAVPLNSIRFVIESGGESSGELTRQVTDVENIVLEQWNKKQKGSEPMQAADLFSYEYLQANRRLKRGTRRFSDLRFPIRRLDEIPKDYGDWGILSIEDFRSSMSNKWPKRVADQSPQD